MFNNDKIKYNLAKNSSTWGNEGGKIRSEFMKFFIVFFTSLTVYYLLFPILQKLGYPNEERFGNWNAFLLSEGFQRTNNIFLYITGCVTFCLTLIIYRLFIFSVIGEKKEVLCLEAYLSFFFVVLSMVTMIPVLNVALLFLRLGSILGVCLLVERIKNRLQINERTLGLLEKILIFFVIVATLIFLKIHVLGNIFIFTKIFLQPINIFLLILLYLLIRSEQKLPKLILWILDALTSILIFILTFRNDVHYFDFSNVVCATTDVLLGKDILQNVISQYGFFNIYFLAAFLKLFNIQDGYVALSYLNSAFYVLGYTFIFLFLRIYTQKVIFSILAFLSIFVINFYSYANVPLHWVPSVGFLRFGTIFPVLFLLVNQRLRQKWYWGWLLAIGVVLSFFWVIETGVYILVAILALAICKYLLGGKCSDRSDLLRVIPKILIVFLCVLCFLALRIWFKYGTWPIWEDFVYYQKHYVLGGLGSLPLKNFYLWPIVVLIYFITIFTCFSFYERIKFADAWLFLSFYGLQCLLYYISLVIIDHLARAALPATILFFIFLGYLLKKGLAIEYRSRQIPLKQIVYLATIILTLWLTSTVDQFADRTTLFEQIKENPKRFIKNCRTNSLVKFFPKDRLQEFKYDILAIQQLTSPQEPIVLISKHDTIYQLYSHRKSFFKIAFYPNFSATKTQTSEAIEKILKSNVQIIFIDHSAYQCFTNRVSEHGLVMKQELSKYFRNERRLGLLDLYRRISP